MDYVIVLIIINLVVVDAINELKKQVIDDFVSYLERAAVGLNTDYNMILHKIAFIQSYSAYDKINHMYEFLKNN